MDLESCGNVKSDGCWLCVCACARTQAHTREIFHRSVQFTAKNYPIYRENKWKYLPGKSQNNLRFGPAYK